MDQAGEGGGQKGVPVERLAAAGEGRKGAGRGGRESRGGDAGAETDVRRESRGEKGASGEGDRGGPAKSGAGGRAHCHLALRPGSLDLRLVGVLKVLEEALLLLYPEAEHAVEEPVDLHPLGFHDLPPFPVGPRAVVQLAVVDFLEEADCQATVLWEERGAQ